MIRNQRAFAVGTLFLLVAATFFIMSLDLARGTAARMGAGYFPWLLSMLLAGIGVAVIGTAIAPSVARERLSAWDLKGLVWITGSVVLFAVLLDPLGLIGALLVLVMVSSRASPDFTWRGSLAAAAVLIVLCVGAFHYGIDLRIPLWPAPWQQ